MLGQLIVVHTLNAAFKFKTILRLLMGLAYFKSFTMLTVRDRRRFSVVVKFDNAKGNYPDNIYLLYYCAH